MKKLSFYIFLVLMWCNVGFAEEDLNGKKLYCKGNNDHLVGRLWEVEEYAAIVFIENHRAILSIMFVMDSKVLDLHIAKTFNYKALEDNIIIRSREDPKLGLDTRLNRESLKLYGSFGDVTRPTCKIVDYDPLEKFEKKIKEIEVTKKKKKKI